MLAEAAVVVDKVIKSPRELLGLGVECIVCTCTVEALCVNEETSVSEGEIRTEVEAV